MHVSILAAEAPCIFVCNQGLKLIVLIRGSRGVWRMNSGGLVSVINFVLCSSTLGVDVERLLETLVRLVVVGEQILQLLFLHLLLVGDRLKHALVVLRRA